MFNSCGLVKKTLLFSFIPNIKSILTLFCLQLAGFLFLLMGLSGTVPLLGAEAEHSAYPIVQSFSSGLMSSAYAEPKELLQQRKWAIDKKRRLIKQKRYELLKKARVHQDRLIQKQMALSQTERKLSYQKDVYSKANWSIGALQKELDVSVGELARLSGQIGQRIKSLYMGESVNALQVLVKTKNITDMLDLVYYQRKLMAQDKALLHQLKEKTQALNAQKRRLEAQRVVLAGSISEINSLKGQLNSQMAEETRLKNKYMGDAQQYARLEDQLLTQSSQLTWLIRRQQLLANKSKEVQAKSTGALMWPLSGRITSGFGYRVHPIFGTRKRHTGIDISRSIGTPVMAADGGKVIMAGWYGGYGKAVIIVHKNGLSTLYGHLSAVYVGSGQSVNKGQSVGAVGSTGYSTGAHLHFEVRVNGSPVNPLGYL
jgi:murein DD-endopeptidase MepM/ murein hydrolase activator NlpD